MTWVEGVRAPLSNKHSSTLVYLYFSICSLAPTDVNEVKSPQNKEMHVSLSNTLQSSNNWYCTCRALLSLAEGKLQFIYNCSQSCKKTGTTIFVAVTYIYTPAIFSKDCEVDIHLAEVCMVGSQSGSVPDLNGTERSDGCLRGFHLLLSWL